MAALGFHCCMQAFSSHGAWASHCDGFSCCGAQALGVWASVVVEHGLSSCGLRALERRLSSCGARALLLRGRLDLPGPGIEPVSPALAGGFLTTAPPRKPLWFLFNLYLHPVSFPTWLLLYNSLFFNIYLCIWLHRVFVAAHGIFIATCRLLVAACMRDLVPWPGSNPGHLHWERGVLPTVPPGKSLEIHIKWNLTVCALVSSSFSTAQSPWDSSILSYQ